MRRGAQGKGGAPRSSNTRHPHILGIDDAPFDKRQHAPVPVIGVMMEGANVVESVAIGAFPVDGDDATAYLSQWIVEFRFFAGLTQEEIGQLLLEMITPVPFVNTCPATPT